MIRDCYISIYTGILVMKSKRASRILVRRAHGVSFYHSLYIDLELSIVHFHRHLWNVFGSVCCDIQLERIQMIYVYVATILG